ncbi:MAG: hypothetical protein NWR50_06060 [Crocinitomicaceae bacterium]|nr:hypothetical protein [Crocinitomicaceae bacterium]
MKKQLFILSFIFSACTTGVELESVDYTTLFTDSNSKVWIVNKMLLQDANIAPIKNEGKDILIFHHNGHCDLIAMKDLTRKPVRKGSFTLDSKKRLMSIIFDDREHWNFEIPYITEDSVLLNATKKSDIPYSIQIKPFPEL